MSGIENYLIKRVVSQGHWYQHKQLLANPPVFELNHQAIFGVIHFLVMTQLKLGHTVLICHRNKGIDLSAQSSALLPSHLHAWQMDLLTPIVNHINDVLRGLVDFKGLFEAIDVVKDNPNEVIHYITQSKHYLQSILLQDDIALSTTKKTQALSYLPLSKLLSWSLWFYYYSQYLINQSFEGLLHDIKRHYFFGEINSDKPLIYHETHDQLFIWLHRSFYAERQLLKQLSLICQSPVQPLSVQVDWSLNEEQRQAVHIMSNQAFGIITGGPGTGKTFTVAQIVKALLVSGEVHLALVAPTGKASQRMKESLQKALGETSIQLPEPMTIHRLLGIGQSGIPHHHQSNPLSYHLIIVDEASMLGVELATWLLSAIKPMTRLILLGDAHQLSAVEAGAVLADLCQLPKLQSLRTQLVISQRFDDGSGVGKLARLIDDEKFITWTQFETLIHQEHSLVFFSIQSNIILEFYQHITTPYQVYFELTKQLKSTFYKMNKTEQIDAIQQLMAVFNQYRILTASHLSFCGDEMMNEHIKKQHQAYLNHHKNYLWYHGRPIIITKNRYDLGLYNGDIGICLRSGKNLSELQVYFEAHDEIRSFNISMLEGDVANTVYAMTIHKSQGSEFHHVAICFDETHERLLSKELIYTAVTRAKKLVSIYATPQAVLSAMNKPTIRQTGLSVLSQMMNMD